MRRLIRWLARKEIVLAYERGWAAGYDTGEHRI